MPVTGPDSDFFCNEQTSTLDALSCHRAQIRVCIRCTLLIPIIELAGLTVSNGSRTRTSGILILTRVVRTVNASPRTSRVPL